MEVTMKIKNFLLKFLKKKKIIIPEQDEFAENNTHELFQPNETMISEIHYNQLNFEDDNNEHIKFFYISDIHLWHCICNNFNTKEIYFNISTRIYIKKLAQQLFESIGGFPPINNYLLIAGDTSSTFKFSVIFFKELVKYWNPNKIIVILGNHELMDPYVDLEENIETYRKFFDKLGIIFLQNDLLFIKSNSQNSRILYEKDIIKMDEAAIQKIAKYYPVAILGGLGFSGLNPIYNASRIIYGKTFTPFNPKEALKKDMAEAARFNSIYQKISSSLYKNKIIVLTHTKKEDWNRDEYNPNWIYVSGHDHHNHFEKNEKRTIHADNQIGYQRKNISLKYFYCDNNYNIFAYYDDGIYEITKEQYIEFNIGKSICCNFNKDGTIYMLKRKNIYMFMMYGYYSKRSHYKNWYILDGGTLKCVYYDKSYFYDNLEKYSENINKLLYQYSGIQRELSEFIKYLGGSGEIHGCIIDIEPQTVSNFSYCHLFVNPIDGKVTPYYAEDIKSRTIYKDLKTLLQSNNNCKQLSEKYLINEKNHYKNLPDIKYSENLEEWQNDYIDDTGTYPYKINNIIKKLQYCIEKNIVRDWNEYLLNYDFTPSKHMEQIDILGDK